MARRKMIAGNWKMNLTPAQAVSFVQTIKEKLEGENEVVFCVPYVDIPAVSEALKGTAIGLGAQNLHFEDSGAYTGEISAKMLSDLGVRYVIIGHSERRQYFGETDILVNRKTIKALENAITPIICVGETLEQREQGITVDLVRQQVKIAFRHLNKGDAARCVVAYEPIWAIGTGQTATSQQAEEVCQAIRKVLGELYGEETAGNIRILYGGSVNEKNAAELFQMGNIDGGLVGGASLKPEFEIIAKA